MAESLRVLLVFNYQSVKHSLLGTTPTPQVEKEPSISRKFRAALFGCHGCRRQTRVAPSNHCPPRGRDSHRSAGVSEHLGAARSSTPRNHRHGEGGARLPPICDMGCEVTASAAVIQKPPTPPGSRLSLKRWAGLVWRPNAKCSASERCPIPRKRYSRRNDDQMSHA